MFGKLIALATLSALLTSGALIPNRASAQPLSSSCASAQAYERVTVHVDSHTEEWVAIYVDGEYMGTVAPYGDLYIEMSADGHILRGETRTGTYGPRYVDLSDGADFHWTLNGD
jgi:hypothetical protein